MKDKGNEREGKNQHWRSPKKSPIVIGMNDPDVYDSFDREVNVFYFLSAHTRRRQDDPKSIGGLRGWQASW